MEPRKSEDEDDDSIQQESNSDVPQKLPDLNEVDQKGDSRLPFSQVVRSPLSDQSKFRLEREQKFA